MRQGLRRGSRAREPSAAPLARRRRWGFLPRLRGGGRRESRSVKKVKHANQGLGTFLCNPRLAKGPESLAARAPPRARAQRWLGQPPARAQGRALDWSTEPRRPCPLFSASKARGCARRRAALRRDLRRARRPAAGRAASPARRPRACRSAKPRSTKQRARVSAARKRRCRRPRGPRELDSQAPPRPPQGLRGSWGSRGGASRWPTKKQRVEARVIHALNSTLPFAASSWGSARRLRARRTKAAAACKRRGGGRRALPQPFGKTLWVFTPIRR